MYSHMRQIKSDVEYSEKSAESEGTITTGENQTRTNKSRVSLGHDVLGLEVSDQRLGLVVDVRVNKDLVDGGN